MLHTFNFIIVMAWLTDEMIVGNLNMIMIEGILECLEILTLQVEEGLMKGYREKEDLMKKEDRSCYKCNNFGHISQNYHAPNDQQNPRSSMSFMQQLWTYSKVL